MARKRKSCEVPPPQLDSGQCPNCLVMYKVAVRHNGINVLYSPDCDCEVPKADEQSNVSRKQNTKKGGQ